MSRYDSIIRLPHPVSKKHPQTPIADRAAQFAPFAALTGYGAAIEETGRFTETKPELDEDEKATLNERLLELQARIRSRPAARIVYFLLDERKAGGAYKTAAGAVKKIDGAAQIVFMADGTRIPFCDIISIDTERDAGEQA